MRVSMSMCPLYDGEGACSELGGDVPTSYAPEQLVDMSSSLQLNLIFEHLSVSARHIIGNNNITPTRNR